MKSHLPRRVLEIVEEDLKAIIRAAIKIEEQSYSLYKMAQRKVDLSSSKKFLEELASEELKHKEKLVSAMEAPELLSQLGHKTNGVEDLRIVDVMEETSLSEDAGYLQILIYAAKREKATYEYYRSLALGLKGTATGELFSKLAREELIHKNKLETEYDDFLKEN